MKWAVGIIIGAVLGIGGYAAWQHRSVPSLAAHPAAPLASSQPSVSAVAHDVTPSRRDVGFWMRDIIKVMEPCRLQFKALSRSMDRNAKTPLAHALAAEAPYARRVARTCSMVATRLNPEKMRVSHSDQLAIHGDASIKQATITAQRMENELAHAAQGMLRVAAQTSDEQSKAYALSMLNAAARDAERFNAQIDHIGQAYQR